MWVTLVFSGDQYICYLGISLVIPQFSSSFRPVDFSVLCYSFLSFKIGKWEWIHMYLEKAMAPHSSEENPMDGGAWWAAVHGFAKSWTRLSDFTFMHWRRKCNPLQCSCLENPRDGGAWWAAVCGVAQSRTRLTRLGSSTYVLTVGLHCCAAETNTTL